MNYTLGIDTTFHTTAIALADDSGRIILDERAHLDIEREDAAEFLNTHSKNLYNILRPVLKKFAKEISLIAVSNQGGAFHSLPVGVNAANILSAVYGNKLIGIGHEAGHIYSNWIDRGENEFRFPSISLNMSAAHGSIWFIQNSGSVKKIKDLIWHRSPDRFSGLGAFFGYFCRYLDVPSNRKKGGEIFSDLALKGKSRNIEEFQNIKFEETSGEIFIRNLFPLENIIDNSRKRAHEEICDLAASLSDRIFSLLSEKIIEIAISYNAKETHLTGGVAANPILRNKMETAAGKSALDFKAPKKADYCFDNAAMIAIAGYHLAKSTELLDILDVQPDQWHYKNYFRYYFKNGN